MQDILGFFGEYRWLSNFAPVDVELDWVVYPTVEHAYQAAKTTDLEYRANFLKATVTDARNAKRLCPKGTRVRTDWNHVKEQVMLDLLLQKFSKEPYLSKLLDTENCYIEETNPWKDTFWGVCVHSGKGENRLGKLIMQIRKDLREILN